MAWPITVHELTAGGTDIGDYIDEIAANISNLTVDGTDAAGAWFRHADGWEVALREASATDLEMATDPLGGFTATNAVADTSEWNGLRTMVDLAATRSADFYLVELADAFFVIWMTSDNSQAAEVLHFGDVWRSLPFANPVRGLGELGDLLDSVPSGILYTSASTLKNRLYAASPGGWYDGYMNGESTLRGYPGGARVPTGVICNLKDVHGTDDRANAGWMRYLFFSPQNNTEESGDFEENGSTDFVYIESLTTSNVDFLIPWDEAVTPIFA